MNLTKILRSIWASLTSFEKRMIQENAAGFRVVVSRESIMIHPDDLCSKIANIDAASMEIFEAAYRKQTEIVNRKQIGVKNG